MKLNNYFPTFRNVLLKKVENTKTKGGILVPSSVSDKIEHQSFTVVKAGKDCLTVEKGDQVVLMKGIQPDPVLTLGDEYYQVMEQQITGYYRT